MAESARQIREWGTRWLRSIGATDPATACAQILDQVEGLILHQLAVPDPAVDLERRLTVAVRALARNP